MDTLEPEIAQPQNLASRLIRGALTPVSDQLEQLDCKLIDYIPTHSRSSQEIIGHIFSAGGKRVRPAIFFMSSRMLRYSGDHLFPIAAVTEYVHTASLLHDDVIDDSTLRRNKPTANTIWGDESAVLVGDLIYSKASEMMAATGNMEVVKTFAKAIHLMSEGELLQLENNFNYQIPTEIYFKILEYKTAILIAATCRSSALLAGVDQQSVDKLNAFGLNLGLAFQLIDDALDYMSTAEVFGKSILADLPEGKVTLPIILLRDRADAKEQKFLAEALQSANLKEKMNLVLELVDKYDTAEETFNLAKTYTAKAMSELHFFPESEERAALEALANTLLLRSN